MDDTNDLDDLRNLHDISSLTMQGRMALALNKPEQALDPLTRAHTLILARFGDESSYAATSGLDLALAAMEAGDNEQAKPLLERSIALYEQLKVSDLRLEEAREALARVHYFLADYDVAEQQFRERIAELERLGQSHDHDRAIALDYLAQTRMRKQDFAGAEQLLLTALALFKQDSKEFPDDLAVCLGMLAGCYFYMFRFREAELCNRKVIEIAEAEHGPDSVNVAKALDHLASCLQMRAQTERRAELSDEAVRLGERACKIFSAKLPPTHRSNHASAMNLANYRATRDSFRGEEDSSELDDAARPAPNVLRAITGERHPDAIVVAIREAFDQAMQGDYDGALAVVERSIAAGCELFGEESGIVLFGRGAALAILRHHCSSLLGEFTGMLSPFQYLVAQGAAHARRGKVEDESTLYDPLDPLAHQRVQDLVNQGVATGRRLIASINVIKDREKLPGGGTRPLDTGWTGDFLELLHFARRLGCIRAEDAIELALEAMQIPETSAATELAATLARQHADPETRALLAEYQRLSLLVHQTNERLVSAAVADPGAAPAAEATPDSRPPRDVQADVLARLTQRASGFAALGHMRRRTLAELQTELLQAGEAVVLYQVSSRAVFVVVVTPKTSSFKRVQIELELLEGLCERVRASAALEDIQDVEGIPKFDFIQAMWLYGLVFAPLERHLEGISDVAIVPDGPLWRLPFGMLVRIPQGEEHEPLALRVARMTVDAPLAGDPEDPLARLIGAANAEVWLADRHALTVLPSLAALAPTRPALDDSTERRPFIGFGNPTFGGEADAAPVVMMSVRTAGASPSFAGLPETERLVEHLAVTLGADAGDDVFVRDDASLERLRELDRAGTLARARVVCFATHAIFPGRDDTLAEPGLALAGGELLLASEAAKLRLDADWVLLTACYTGAASGRTITDPLSGLARAFFTAGARSLLVSHWPVDVHATQALISELFAPDNRGRSHGVALQRAMRSLRKRGAHHAHPGFWAAFSVVGRVSDSARS